MLLPPISQSCRLKTLFKKRLVHRCCPVNFTIFFQNTHFVKRLQLAASVDCQADINLEKNLIEISLIVHLFDLIMSEV